MRVLLSSAHTIENRRVQTPNNDGVWQDLLFEGARNLADPTTGVELEREGDWLLVYDQPSAGLHTRVPRERRIAILSEPPEVKRYPADYLRQFGIVISFLPLRLAGVETIWSQIGYAWMYDWASQQADYRPLDWQGLRDAGQGPREDAISVICSNKEITWAQSRRLRFIEMLEARIGDRLKIFGMGFRPIDRKADAIDRYRWHLALENNVAAYSFTEKLADSLIGRANTIYAGDVAIEESFPAESLDRIDLSRPRAAVDQVARLLEAGPSAQRHEANEAARDRLFFEHNLFAMLTRVIKARAPGRNAPLVAPEPLLPPRTPRWRRRLPRIKGAHAVALRRRYLDLAERN